MTGEISIERRLEQMSKRLERAERANRVMKIGGSIGFATLIAFGSGPFASTVMAKKVKPPTAEVAAQAFDLENSSGQILATLTQVSGKPNLVFFDGSGKTVLGVGLTSNAAGITVVDGNSILAGSGIARNTWGITNSGALSGIGGATFDADGKQRTRWGDAIDDSSSGIQFDDSNGAFRTGVEYDPTTAFFNGFSTYDGSGHPLSVLGNVLATEGPLSANDSFMELLDTTGQLRVLEFQNSTNEGGVDYNEGAGTTVQGGWGNF